MPAKSQASQKFMGMVLEAKRTGKSASPAVAKAAKSMTEKSARDFASTKRKGLPKHSVMSAMKKRLNKKVE
jgi:hypothetical protein